MEIEYELTLDDVLALNEYRSFRSPAIRRQYLIRRLVSPVLLAVLWVGLYPMFRGAGGSPEIWVIFGLLFALLGAVLFFSYPTRVRRKTRHLVARMYMEGQNRALFARRRLTIQPETITDATEITVTTMKWVAIEEIALDTRHVYFYNSSLSAIILPSAAFPTEDRFREFVETAQRYHREAGG